MLAASFLILRIFIDKMLLNAHLFFNRAKNLNPNAYINLRMIAACFYYAWEDSYSGINPIRNNLEVIEYVDHPKLRTKAILFGIT